MIFSVTFVPAAVAIFMSGKVSEKENFVMRGAKSLYNPLLRSAIANRGVVVTGAAVLVVLSLLLASRMGSEFIPNLDEGDLAVHSLRIPGTSLTQAIDMQNAVQKKFREFPGSKGNLRQDRHRRSRDRPDAAERGGRFRHAQTARGMAQSAPRQNRIGQRDGGKNGCRSARNEV